MSSYHDLVAALTWLVVQKLQHQGRYVRGLLGDGQGHVQVPERPDYSYVRPDRYTTRKFEVFNKLVDGYDGMPVVLGELPWQPGLTQVLSVDYDTYEGVGWGDQWSGVKRHGSTHEWRNGAPGYDTFNVYGRQWGDLKTYPLGSGSMSVYVSAYNFAHLEETRSWPGYPGLSLAGAVPSATGTARMVLVYWDPASGTSGSLGVATGTLGGDTGPEILDWPTVPIGSIPSAWVKLRGGQGFVAESDIWDARAPFAPVGDGWKFSGVVRVVGPNGDYASVTLAAAAANAGDIIWVEGGGFTETAIIPAGVHLWGMGQQVTTISSGAATPTLTLGANCSLMNIQVGNSFAGGVAISTSSFAYLYDVYAWVTGGGNPAALQTNADTVRLYNVTLTGKWAISMASAANALYIFASDIAGQAVIGTDIHDAVGAGNNVYMRAVPTIGHAVSGVRIDATIGVYGTFVDPNGQLYSRTDGLIQMDERAGAPANPPANNWDQWFESDGLHILDDTGAEYIFPGGIDPAGHNHSKLVASDGAPDPAFSSDASGNATGVGWIASDAHAFKVKNTSGGAAVANDLGYIDENGEYKTTTTAYADVAWCVVLVGGANNADIYVARRGRVTVTLNGNCSAGDYLYTSTTAGQAQPQSYTRPELFAVALTANAGGAGGTCSALLLTSTDPRAKSSSNDLFRIDAASDSDFVATIATLPGGAVLTYNAPISGDEINLVPTSTSQLAKMVLHNTTRGDNALISNCVTGTNTITLTANVPGTWQVGDTITIRSQTNTDLIGASYFVDFEIVSEVNALARSISFLVTFVDSGAANKSMWFHTYETGAASKRRSPITQVANQILTWQSPPISLFQNRFCVAWDASGAGTILTVWRWQEERVAVP